MAIGILNPSQVDDLTYLDREGIKGRLSIEQCERPVWGNSVAYKYLRLNKFQSGFRHILEYKHNKKQDMALRDFLYLG